MLMSMRNCDCDCQVHLFQHLTRRMWEAKRDPAPQVGRWLLKLLLLLAALLGRVSCSGNEKRARRRREPTVRRCGHVRVGVVPQVIRTPRAGRTVAKAVDSALHPPTRTAKRTNTFHKIFHLTSVKVGCLILFKWHWSTWNFILSYIHISANEFLCARVCLFGVQIQVSR